MEKEVKQLTKTQKRDLRRRCYGIIEKQRERQRVNINEVNTIKLFRDLGVIKALPVLYYRGQTRAFRGANFIFKTYLECLFEESLKENISSINIKDMGLLQIRELDPVGKRQIIYSNGKKIGVRLDTIFDSSVMYNFKVNFYLYASKAEYVSFKLRSNFVNKMLRTLYLKELDHGVYPSYKTNFKKT